MKVERRHFSGYFSTIDKMPDPNVQLSIILEENEDHVGGGAAAFGSDGKWYWTFNEEITEECVYTVKSWCYLEKVTE